MEAAAVQGCRGRSRAGGTCRDQALPSWTAVAVRPAAVLPVPVVCTLRGLSRAANFMSCDLPAGTMHAQSVQYDPPCVP